jgi:probable selenium-dependent hydroxylase accessory protein YqeC
MFAMARELATLGNHVLTSTTTKIFPDVIHRYGHFTVAESRLAGKKLRGVSPELINELGALDKVDHVLVEADGAARLPLKAPDENEPVIPSKTSLVVVVVGIDSLGVELSADHVFRPHIVSELTGLPLGGTVTVEVIAELIVHPRGMAKGAPPHSTIIPFLNKVDTPDGLKKGKVLARRILEKEHPQINRVVLGHAIHEMPVAAVVSRKVDA